MMSGPHRYFAVFLDLGKPTEIICWFNVDPDGITQRQITKDLGEARAHCARLNENNPGWDYSVAVIYPFPVS